MNKTLSIKTKKLFNYLKISHEVKNFDRMILILIKLKLYVYGTKKLVF